MYLNGTGGYVHSPSERCLAEQGVGPGGRMQACCVCLK